MFQVHLRFSALVLLAVLLLAGCSGTARFTSDKESGRVVFRGKSQEATGTSTEFAGVASYYGPKFHGRKTASGETFDMYQYTAAHRALPFGTRIRVTNQNNGKTVVVRVNDRGPFVKNRILDLSYAAAKEIDLVTAGTAQISILILK